MKNKAIIVLGYNRPEALSNLLKSLSMIKSDGTRIPLIISIDNRGTPEVNQIAQEYKWDHGEKKVIIHEKKLGLKAHFMFTGDITEEYDNVIFLEDDLVVSPYLLDFCNAYLETYLDDDRIAGASLYNPILKEGVGSKFYQIEDGYDVFFLQQPYWGNIWSKRKWRLFKKWLSTYRVNNDILPYNIAEWKDSSFKKVFIQYEIETERYFVTPRVSLLSNNGEAGLHNTIGKYQYQCNMMMNSKKYSMPDFDDSMAVYDVYFELLPQIIKKYNAKLEKYDFYVDLYKQKRLQADIPYCLTTRRCKSSICSFSNQMKPKELAVLCDAQGCGIVLCKTKDMDSEIVNRSAILFEDILDNYLVDLKTAFYVFKYKVKGKISSLFRR